jgi:hypothetical protein
LSLICANPCNLRTSFFLSLISVFSVTTLFGNPKSKIKNPKSKMAARKKIPGQSPGLMTARAAPRANHPSLVE